MIKTITILPVATTLLLTSCSSKFGSRAEARKVAEDYQQKENKEVVVIVKPSERVIKKETDKRQAGLKRQCENDKLWMKEETDSVLAAYSVQAKAFYEENCFPRPAYVMNKEEIERLTRLEKEQAIECKEEKETNQLLRKEWKTNRTKMDSDEWFSAKSNYSCFRY